MMQLWGWIKDKWYVIVGAIGLFILWLRFFHDPQIQEAATLAQRKKELEARVEELSDSTAIEGARGEIRAIDERIEEIRKSHPDADAAADFLRRRFGWGSDQGTSR